MPDPLERSPIAAAPLSVLLPAHNAQAHLGELLQSWIAYLDTLQREYEILLIDDGSTDDTRKIAEDLAGKQPRLQVLRHETHRGFGASLRTGLGAARHPLFFYSTCDRLYQPAELKKLLDRIDQADLVSGYRAGRPVPM